MLLVLNELNQRNTAAFYKRFNHFVTGQAREGAAIF
jgi:hypothetical protein